MKTLYEFKGTPVRLSHAYLRSVGFNEETEGEHGDDYLFFRHKSDEKVTVSWTKGEDGTEMFYWVDPYKEIKYVHELQNLAFVLRDLELQKAQWLSPNPQSE